MAKYAATFAESTPYDLILMDCHMPELDGFEAAAAVRALEASGVRGRIPIVALTASATAEDRAKCLRAGMDDVVTKPIAVGELRHALERWSQQGHGAKSLATAEQAA